MTRTNREMVQIFFGFLFLENLNTGSVFYLPFPAVLLPTPETLDALASVPNRPLLLVNTQWQPGQVSVIGQPTQAT